MIYMEIVNLLRTKENNRFKQDGISVFLTMNNVCEYETKIEKLLQNYPKIRGIYVDIRNYYIYHQII